MLINHKLRAGKYKIKYGKLIILYINFVHQKSFCKTENNYGTTL